MKLYTSVYAPNPRRVRWVMAEKGIDGAFPVVSLDLNAGEHRTPDYVARTGQANVPLLELDDGSSVTESVAICRYLESRYPEPNLFGATPEESAVIEMWTRRAEMQVATPLMMAVRHTHPGLAQLEANQTPAVGEYNLRAATAALKGLERRLEGREFIAADRVTMADIVAVIGLDFARLIRFRVPEELVNVERWRTGMLARPAAKAGTRADA